MRMKKSWRAKLAEANKEISRLNTDVSVLKKILYHVMDEHGFETIQVPKDLLSKPFERELELVKDKTDEKHFTVTRKKIYNKEVQV